MWRMHSYWARLVALFQGRRWDRSLDEELDAHLESLEEEYRRQGMTAREARRAAHLALGGVEQIKELHREARAWTGLEACWRDAASAFRNLRRRPGFAVAVTLSLALGLGVNSAMFSLVNAFLFRPLPVRHAHRLVAIATQDHHFVLPHEVSYPNFAQLRDQTGVFAGAVAASIDVAHLSDESGAAAERVYLEPVSGDFFGTLGVELALGRDFNEPESRLYGATPAIVLSHSFWQRRYAGDRAIAGRTVKLNGHAFTVVGVTPEAFSGTLALVAVHGFVPLGVMELLHPERKGWLEQRDREWLRVIARLKPDATLEQARTAVAAVAQRLKTAYPDKNQASSFVVAPEVRSRPAMAVSDRLPRVAAMLLVIAGMVLVVAVASLANLFLAAVVARRQEVAVRAALGAGRGRLMRQWVMETLLLALAGGVAGVLLGRLATAWLMTIRLAMDAPVRLDVAPDWRVYLYTLAASLLVGGLACCAPAWMIRKFSASGRVQEALKSGGREHTGDRAWSRFRGALVSAQVAFSLVLLVCSGLFLESLHNAQKLDLGFRNRDLLMASFDLPPLRYDPVRGRQFQDRLMREIRALPGVRSAALASVAMVGENNRVVEVEEAAGQKQMAFANFVDVAYFQTMGIALRAGRWFAASDHAAAPPVVIVNEAMARRYWPAGSAVGQYLRLAGEARALEVVGVVPTAKYMGLNEEPRPFLYRPLAQHYDPSLVLHVTPVSEPAALATAIRRVFQNLDADLPVFDVRTFEEHLQRGVSLTAARIGAALVAGFSGLGLMMSSIGLYGLVAFVVARSARDLSIRVALGARPRQILRHAAGQGLRWGAMGMAFGLAGAAAAGRLIAGMLYGVSPFSPLALAGATLLLGCLTLLACLIPARRTLLIDPARVLRHD
jgi:predicted permease